MGQRYLKFSCPQSTKCYFGDQRQLSFFRIYSQQNCELECRTNYFLDTRNCVLPYMPRPIGVQLCNDTSVSEDQLQKEIMIRAISQDIPLSKYFVQSCNCLPTCNEIRYKSNASNSSLKSANYSEVLVRFEKDHFYGSRITVRYGVVEFLASCGGLLSLFLGISFITVVEMLYYCTLKPILV
ncbi:pickpocket protein 28-like [Ochlerotatus camptorhynchus]|uniref:pickpocket protein 28-like n=1 Tax=Ochlerotatus camptorhynchus TaxID=644619 RepID=UPI0031DBACAC